MATAGMSLPYEEAKQLLQREVYRLGMALRHSDRFDLEKFNFMNEVLVADGAAHLIADREKLSDILARERLL